LERSNSLIVTYPAGSVKGSQCDRAGTLVPDAARVDILLERSKPRVLPGHPGHLIGGGQHDVRELLRVTSPGTK